jgi:hypothetical protein
VNSVIVYWSHLYLHAASSKQLCSALLRVNICHHPSSSTRVIGDGVAMLMPCTCSVPVQAVRLAPACWPQNKFAHYGSQPFTARHDTFLGTHPLWSKSIQPSTWPAYILVQSSSRSPVTSWLFHHPGVCKRQQPAPFTLGDCLPELPTFVALQTGDPTCLDHSPSTWETSE